LRRPWDCRVAESARRAETLLRTGLEVGGILGAGSVASAGGSKCPGVLDGDAPQRATVSGVASPRWVSIMPLHRRWVQRPDYEELSGRWHRRSHPPMDDSEFLRLIAPTNPSASPLPLCTATVVSLKTLLVLWSAPGPTETRKAMPECQRIERAAGQPGKHAGASLPPSGPRRCSSGLWLSAFELDIPRGIKAERRERGD